MPGCGVARTGKWWFFTCASNRVVVKLSGQCFDSTENYDAVGVYRKKNDAAEKIEGWVACISSVAI